MGEGRVGIRAFVRNGRIITNRRAYKTSHLYLTPGFCHGAFLYLYLSVDVTLLEWSHLPATCPITASIFYFTLRTPRAYLRYLTSENGSLSLNFEETFR